MKTRRELVDRMPRAATALDPISLGICSSPYLTGTWLKTKRGHSMTSDGFMLDRTAFWSEEVKVVQSNCAPAHTVTRYGTSQGAEITWVWLNGVYYAICKAERSYGRRLSAP